jgi:hypothetical protein
MKLGEQGDDASVLTFVMSSMVFWWLSALSLVLSCARSEPASSTTLGAAPPADAPRPTSPEPATSPLSIEAPVRDAQSFQTIAPGLAVLSRERLDADGIAHSWTVVRIDLGVHRLEVRARGEAPFADLRAAPDVLVAVNGGFFDPGLAASGLLISEGVRLARERSGGGSGVLVIAQGRARLSPRGAALPDGADFAVQCGPRLIEPDGSVGIRTDDGKRAARTVACIRDGGRELDIVVAVSKERLGSGPGLFQLARWLAEPLAPGEPSGCEAALNLDGGPSTGLVVAPAPELFRAPLGPVPFVLVVPRVAPRAE